MLNWIMRFLRTFTWFLLAVKCGKHGEKSIEIRVKMSVRTCRSKLFWNIYTFSFKNEKLIKFFPPTWKNLTKLPRNHWRRMKYVYEKSRNSSEKELRRLRKQFMFCSCFLRFSFMVNALINIFLGFESRIFSPFQTLQMFIMKVSFTQ